MQMRFPETVSDSLCRNSLVMQTDCCSSCPGGWSQTILEVKMLDVEVLGCCGYTWSAVVRPVAFFIMQIIHQSVTSSWTCVDSNAVACSMINHKISSLLTVRN